MTEILGTNQSDNLVGTDGADIINAGNGNDTISSGSGSDIINGGNGQDTIDGGAGNDTLSGGNGNDILDGGAGSDTVYGNNGDDTAIYVVADDVGATDFYNGGSGIDMLVLELTQAQLDEMNATSVFSDFSAVFGTDAIFDFASYGFSFGMKLSVTRFEQLLFATVSNPALFTANIDIVDFNNIVAGSYLAGTQYDALGGNDNVTLAANETEAAEAGFVIGTAFNAGDGNDRVNGNGLDDIIYGGAGDDGITGAGGNDTIYGGDGVNEIVGGVGNDVLFGGADHDVFREGLGNDTIDGAGGVDRVDYTGSSSGIQLNLATGVVTSADGTDALSNIEGIFGSNFADEMIGDSGNNPLGGIGFAGFGGDDHLVGGNGHDTLYGDSPEPGPSTIIGDDTLAGGLGDDVLWGGGGADTFVFERGWQNDTIGDFTQSVDVIDLRATGLSDISQLSLTQFGTQTVIDFGGGDTLRLDNVNAASLTNDDFLF